MTVSFKAMPPRVVGNVDHSCIVRGCRAHATMQRARYGGQVLIEYCAPHHRRARRFFPEATS